MANFAAQLKDRFLGLVERVAGCGRGAAGDKDVKEPTKLSTVQHIEIRSRDPNVNGGDKPPSN
ncbi:hypothetical protein E2562_004305 [Oryza meyeriana var. granulata]|uniref:Uncharacterized protein n=1 Tax=Oryza meyeriana var. granulata TaxID=110450 RepID=A0A6G1BSZ7_9ORYZ|nr:hypothetical protein E2562_004305 [Oryza meyeriana var. granulata]